MVESGTCVFPRLRMSAWSSRRAVAARAHVGRDGLAHGVIERSEGESSAMILSADAICRRATSISARAVSGLGGTVRIFFAVRSLWTSASGIDALDERDQGLLLDRPDEPGRVRLPILLRENG